jgi:glycerol-3-phosphate dehydrogenase
MTPLHTQALIIGGGATGTGLARDLALRGVHCILVEKQDINAGASGGNHGLLHSGARYVATDSEAARECGEEGEILKRMASHCIEDTGGFFAAVEGDDETYIADFPGMCAQSGIFTEPVDIKDAREAEPQLTEKLIAVYRVQDATVDPFKLSLDNISQACSLGSLLMRNTRAASFITDNKHIRQIRLINTVSGLETLVEAGCVINAAGAWAGEVAGLAGITIPMLCSKGSLLVTQDRITRRVINRLRKATDADILVPGGTVSILGTTSVRVETPDSIRPTIHEVNYIIEEAARMIPVLETTRYIRAYCGVRPLISPASSGDDRSVTRGFVLMDHAGDGIENFITITGGKLTTYRLMAEKTADKVCAKLGITSPCKTRIEPLPATEKGKWTEPGLAPRLWAEQNDPEDTLLCECEMVFKSAVDSITTAIHDQNGFPTLKAIGLRSRVGKGPCQGCFCSPRIVAHMYDRGELNVNQGPDELRTFLNERWRGKYPILWDLPLMQSELQEALHCGLFSLEL